MTLLHDAVIAQFTDELGDRLRAIAMLDRPDAVIEADVRAEAIVARTVPVLLSDDQREAAQAACAVLCALWPSNVPDSWWMTPLGRVSAEAILSEGFDNIPNTGGDW